MKVTFKLSDGRTHTHRGQIYVDGDTADVSARDRDRLDSRGVIAKRRVYRKSKKTDESE